MRRAPGLLAGAGAAALAVVGTACEDSTHRDIGDEINILIRRNDALVPPAIQRLAAYGRLAIPQVETALHTAAPQGRMNLLRTLEIIGDPEAATILRHFAVYDVKPEVRAECEAVLSRWAAGGGPRAERAREALVFVARRRERGEGPVVFPGGAPGVPIVGAPEPVGSKL